MRRWKQHQPVVEIGDARGRVAIYFTETRAWDYHDSLHSSDGFREEISAAIMQAYPSEEQEADRAE